MSLFDISRQQLESLYRLRESKEEPKETNPEAEMTEEEKAAEDLRVAKLVEIMSQKQCSR